MNPADPRIRRAVSELEGLIRERFPSARFVVSRGEDPDGIYLDAIVDLDDPDPVMDVSSSACSSSRSTKASLSTSSPCARLSGK